MVGGVSEGGGVDARGPRTSPGGPDQAPTTAQRTSSFFSSLLADGILATLVWRVER